MAFIRLIGEDEATGELAREYAYFNYINRVADAVGVDDEPEWGERT